MRIERNRIRSESYVVNLSEGRKKIKDLKVTGKKKRSLSDEDEKVDEKVSSAAAQNKSSKKQKVNQEKDGRKAQKVIITITIHSCCLYREIL